jgi:hypothetical protein
MLCLHRDEDARHPRCFHLFILTTICEVVLFKTNGVLNLDVSANDFRVQFSVKTSVASIDDSSNDDVPRIFGIFQRRASLVNPRESILSV